MAAPCAKCSALIAGAICTPCSEKMAEEALEKQYQRNQSRQKQVPTKTKKQAFIGLLKKYCSLQTLNRIVFIDLLKTKIKTILSRRCGDDRRRTK